MQNRNTKGFTLIELLIVVVIIGILAAIAIPKFSATRERAFISAMKTDLRNLSTQQELYYNNPANGYSYTDDLTALEFTPSSNVGMSVDAATTVGWSATATHASTTVECGMTIGLATAATPATTVGVVGCTGGA